MNKGLMGGAASALMALCFATASASSLADVIPTYGYVYNEQLYAFGSNYNGADYYSTYGSAQQAIQSRSFATSSSLEGTDYLYGYGVSTAFVKNSLSDDGQNIGLHAYTRTTSSLTGSNTSGPVYANTDLMYFDTFHVGGVGGRISVSFTIEGSIGGTNNSASDNVQAFIGLYSTLTGLSCPNDSTPNTPTALPFVAGYCYNGDAFHQTFSKGFSTYTGTVTYNVDAGADFMLGLDLGIRNSYGNGTSTVDFGNTGFLQILALDGVSLTTDSGLTYVDPPAKNTSNSVPEPSTYTLLSSALFGLAFSQYRRRNMS